VQFRVRGAKNAVRRRATKKCRGRIDVLSISPLAKRQEVLQRPAFSTFMTIHSIALPAEYGKWFAFAMILVTPGSFAVLLVWWILQKIKLQVRPRD
jgi:hypothetical protein